MPVLTFDLPEAVADELERLAAAECTSVQALIIAALKNRLTHGWDPDTFGNSAADGHSDAESDDPDEAEQQPP